jgi:hypothetical protein
VTIIKLHHTFRKITDHFPDPYRNERAKTCLRQLWGWPDVNDCGVFNDWEEAVHIAHPKQRLTHAEVRIAVAPNGWHTIGVDWSYPLGGGCYAPSVWDRTAYTTREEALNAAMNEITMRFEGMRDFSIRCHEGEGPIRMIDWMLDQIQQFRRPPSTAAQLSLF